MAEKNLNRIKVMLAEKGKTNKWLAEKLGRDQATISKWCTNACQPPLEALIQISQCLEVDIKELIRVPEHNRLYRYCPWMRGMAASQISCNNGIDKETFVPLHHGKEK